MAAGSRCRRPHNTCASHLVSFSSSLTAETSAALWAALQSVLAHIAPGTFTLLTRLYYQAQNN
jgi:hypothetical protein